MDTNFFPRFIIFCLILNVFTNNLISNNNDPLYSKAEKDFFENLNGLCGKTYKGKQIYISPGKESWENNALYIHARCKENEVNLNFIIDDDKSRSWIFILENDGLRIRHDHKNTEGIPEEINLYGGYVSEKGTAFKQRFESDYHTKSVLNDNIKREWLITFSNDLSTFKYFLFYDDNLIVEVEFDLKNQVNINK